MTTVALVRRFYEWREDADGLAQSRYRAAAGLSDGLLGWSDLLAKRRVVILAEAGSVKTEELEERARLQTIAGNSLSTRPFRTLDEAVSIPPYAQPTEGA